MVSESSRFDSPLLKHRGCICRTWDVALTPSVPSDMGHVPKLGRTQDGKWSSPSAHKLRYPHYHNTSPTPWGCPHTLDTPWAKQDGIPVSRLVGGLCAPISPLKWDFAKTQGLTPSAVWRRSSWSQGGTEYLCCCSRLRISFLHYCNAAFHVISLCNR